MTTIDRLYNDKTIINDVLIAAFPKLIRRHKILSVQINFFWVTIILSILFSFKTINGKKYLQRKNTSIKGKSNDEVSLKDKKQA